MNTINHAHINALLADAAYADVSPAMSIEDLTAELQKRSPSILAAYIATNFEVASAIDTPDIPLLGSGFDATVFRGRAGTPYAGQVFVSTRGTEPPGVDIWGADADLAINVAARTQVIDMVNWWLKGTSPSGVSVAQIKWDPLRVKPGTVSTPEPGLALGQSMAGTGELVGVTSVQVNGHSLGGHLASAFARIFGGNNYQPGSVRVEGVSTFNSAGFNGTQSEPFFAQVQSLLGTGMGSFAPLTSLQTNYFAANGVNFTTNDWWFTQMGQRIGLNQEEGIGPTNHSMYHLTDLLALGSALEKLDPSFTLDKLNTLVKVGSNSMAASYEGVLDGLRRMVLGANVTPTPASDSADATGRSTYHANLKDLTDSNAFKALALTGKVTLSVASAGLATSAKGDFGAFLSLNALSPVVINAGGDATATATLGALDPNLYASWQADKNARLYGDTTKALDYSDNWYADRAAMLQAIVTRNEQDIGGIVPGTQNLLYFDTASNTEVLVGAGSSLRTMVRFGSADAESLEGGAFADHLYGGAGNDTLDGLGGNDYLEGGKETDTYRFSGSFGKDTVVDADGMGQIQLGGQAIGTANAAGQRNLWTAKVGGTVYELRVLDDTRSTTGKTLVISPKGDSANSITIKNFDLTQALGSQGYLGIKLDSTQKLALVQGSGTTVGTSTTNVWADPDFDEASLAGKSSTVDEGNAKSFNLYLAQGAHAGDTVTLALGGEVTGKFKAVLGDSTVEANGAVITLAEGQTVVSFALVQEGEVTADAAGALSASYQGVDAGSQGTASNSWALSLKDADGTPRYVLQGDQSVTGQEDWTLNADGSINWVNASEGENSSQKIASNRYTSSAKAYFCFKTKAANDGWLRRLA